MARPRGRLVLGSHFFPFPLLEPGISPPLSSRFSLSPFPQTFGLVEMEPKYSHGTISVVFKIKKKICVCLYNIPFSVGSVSMTVLRSLVPGNRACCLSFHLPSASIRRPCSYSLSSQGGAFPAPIQTQLQETSRKRLPSGLDSSWGPLVGELWEARQENLYRDSCKEERLPRNPALPFLCASIYSRDRKKKKYDYQQEFILQDLRTEA